MALWKISADKLAELPKSKLNSEARLEDWIAADTSILGLDVLIIGRQVATAFGGRIDLLVIDQKGDLVILELKRDRTPRDIVAQVLDYATWVKDLTPKDIDAIASAYLQESLAVAFAKRFGVSLPESINSNHGMVIIASELDDSSERIVQYLATVYGVNINAIFFSFFRDNDNELVG
ncbi:MAG TPA: endonuclease NucS domain-containing protein, partial [Dehalococcoidia bacterium]|nr:endonuclease NucS domain-containing protein [Dehalococcoidia bacterium]